MPGCAAATPIGDAETLRAFDKIRNHFGINRMAKAAGEAALKDQAYLVTVVGRVHAARSGSATSPAQRSRPLPSATNFVTIDCGSDGAFALNLLQALIARDVFMRKPMAPGLDRCIRISAGLDGEMDILAEELPQALQTARQG